MSEVKSVQEASYNGVSVDHPRIADALKNCAKQGMSKVEAAKIVGMPMEVVDRYYHEASKK